MNVLPIRLISQQGAMHKHTYRFIDDFVVLGRQVYQVNSVRAVRLRRKKKIINKVFFLRFTLRASRFTLRLKILIIFIPILIYTSLRPVQVQADFIRLRKLKLVLRSPQARRLAPYGTSSSASSSARLQQHHHSI